MTDPPTTPTPTSGRDAAGGTAVVLAEPPAWAVRPSQLRWTNEALAATRAELRRRRLRRRTTVVMTALLIPIALLGAIVLFGGRSEPPEPLPTSGGATAPDAATGDAPGADGATSPEDGTPQPLQDPRTEVKGTVLERDTSPSAPDPAPTTTTPKDPEPCDDPAVAAALRDAPVAQEIVGAPVCSSTFAVATTRDEKVPDDELLVILRRSDSGWEAVAVIRPEYCSRLPADEPDFDVSLCPS